MACEKLPPKVDGEDVAFGDCCAMPKPDDPKIDDPVVCCGGELKPVEPPNIEPPETAPELPPPNIVPDCGDVALFAMKISIILFYRKFHIFLNCKKKLFNACILDVAGLLLPPNTFVDVFAAPNTDVPNVFCVGDDAPPPKIDVEFVALLLLPPPKIF